MADEATVQILLKAKADGMDAISDMSSKLGDLRTRALEAAAALGIQGGAQSLGGAVQNMSTGFLNGIPFIGGWLAKIGEIPVAGPILVAALAAITAALIVTAAAFVGTAVVITAAVATILTATVAGFAALAAGVTLALGPLGLLTAGVVLLADRLFTTGKIGTDPLLAIEQALGKMADTWAQKALPMANQMIAWAQNLIPPVTAAGNAILTWFGDRLPLLMAGTTVATQAMAPVVVQLAGIWAGFIDQVMARMPQIGPILQQAMGVGVQAVQGLLTNLLRFMDWFIGEWPKLQPIVQQVMEQAGRFIQWFGQQAAQLVDWFVKNWPQIAKQAQELMPVLNALVFMVQMVFFAFVELMRIEDKIVGFLGNVGRAFSGLGSIVSGVAGALDRVGSAIGVIQSAGSFTGGGGGGGGFQSGGIVPGPVGAPMLAMVHGGERVIPVGGRGTDMGDTNELLAHCARMLTSIEAKVGGGLSTRAYASRA